LHPQKNSKYLDMAKQITGKKDWDKRKPTEMAAKALYKVSKMTANTNFPTPEVPLTGAGSLTVAANLVNTLYAARNDNPENKTNFKNAVNDLDEKLTLQMSYVSYVAGGVATIIQSGGFVATTNGRTVAVRLGDTPTPKLTPMGGNRVKSVVAKMPGSKIMTHIFFTDPESIISVDIDTISCMSTNGGSFFICSGSNNKEMGGLTANKKVYCCAVGKNKVGYGNLSAITSTGVLGS